MNTAVIGLHWGDEGKGSVVDFLTQFYDFVVRYKGGNNAGHTVIDGDEVYKLHLVPSGITQRKECIIGQGVVIDPFVLKREIEGLQERGVEIVPGENLFLSEKAHMILPWHKIFDGISGGKIGTTGRGIGPCYSDAAARDGIRFYHVIDRHGDIDKKTFEQRIEEVLEERNKILEKVYGLESLSKSEIANQYLEAVEFLRPFIADTSRLILDLIKDGKNCLFEGAQANLLDIDNGTYPYVTSSNCGVSGIYSGAGVKVNLDRIVGVAKAYTTRVGGGPFPTELTDEDRVNNEVKAFVLEKQGITKEEFDKLNAEEQSKIRIKWVKEYNLSPEEEAVLKEPEHPDYDHVLGKQIMIQGQEFGTTTGRCRRVGWHDAVATRYSVESNGVTDIALTKQAPLDSLERISICDDYDIDGEQTSHFPCRLQDLEAAKPVYEEAPGWKCPTAHIKDEKGLPNEFVDYVGKLEKIAGASISILSIGADRKTKILLDDSLIPG